MLYEEIIKAIDYPITQKVLYDHDSIADCEPYFPWSGPQNKHDSLASSIPAKLFDLRNKIVKDSMSGFKTIEHRLEFVARIDDINFINDSKATNVNATWYALETMKGDVVLILGGVDNGSDYTVLKPLVRQKVVAIVCLGENAFRIQKVFADDVETTVTTCSMQDTVQQAYGLAKKNGTVLLSPACASFDLFKNYEDRGKQFKQAVKEL